MTLVELRERVETAKPLVEQELSSGPKKVRETMEDILEQDLDQSMTYSQVRLAIFDLLTEGKIVMEKNGDLATRTP